jgi:hypothetical protein
MPGRRNGFVFLPRKFSPFEVELPGSNGKAIDMIEMRVAGYKHKVVLDRRGGDPDVVFWNRPAFAA